jgi:NNP family nitrate/nitrite transporter-like MFS transporter
VRGELTLNLGLNVWLFTSLLFIVGIAWGFGKASVFKYIGDEYPHNIGVISGIVGLIGGLGGFLFPILFGMLVDFTGINSSIFMLLFAVTCWSLIWMYTTEVCGVKTLRLIASTGKEAAEKAADAESVVGDDAGGTENASAGVRPPPLRHPS